MAVISERLGFIGLGTMGHPMAGHLLAAGAPVTIWNRTPGRGTDLEAAGATRAADLDDLAQKSDVILLCVNRTEDVRQCVSALRPSLRPGMLVIDHSTIAPRAAKEIYADLGSMGVAFVDAPITGGSMGAQKGQLTLFCGGEEEAVERAIRAFAPYSKRAERVGGPGCGQAMKLANQSAVAGALLALCESIAFAKRSGLDPTQAHSMIAGGAGGSWAFDNYGPKLLAADWSPGFSVKNQRKDLAYCVDAANEIGLDLPGVELVDSLLAKLTADGREEEATVALYDVLLGGSK